MNLENTVISWFKRDINRTSLLTASLVFLIAGAVFSQYGFKGILSFIDAIYLYSGQQMAQGVPPYVSIFDHKGPLAPLISGIGVSIATLLNLNDIFVVRIVFLVLSSLTVVGVYFLSSALFSSQKIGFLTAFTYIGFSSFGTQAASGPESKTPMVLFAVFALLFTSHKKWFWAGICGSLALLTWQPAGIYALIAIALAFLQSEPGRARVRNMLLTISGVLIPIIIVSLYFVYKGAFYDLIDGAILYNIFYLERLPYPLIDRILRPIMVVNTGFTSMALPIFIGFFMTLLVCVWRLRLYGSSFLKWIRKDYFPALLLSFAAAVIWSVLDLQGRWDLYIFLPYVAIGFGWLLCLALDGLLKIKEIGTTMQKICFFVLCIILLGSAASNYRVTANNKLEEQRQWAQQIESKFEVEAKLVSIGGPELLVLLRRTNPNQYVFISDGIDNKINATTIGGFEGWLEELERYDPDIITLGWTQGRFKPVLMDWLKSNYHRKKFGTFTLYVKNHP